MRFATPWSAEIDSGQDGQRQWRFAGTAGSHQRTWHQADRSAGWRRSAVLWNCQVLAERFGKDRFEVIPHVSSMQLAFARVKESWDDAYLSNLATQPLDRVVDNIRTAERVGLFTTEEISPSVVAGALLDRRIDYFTVYVCENLGTPAES